MFNICETVKASEPATLSVKNPQIVKPSTIYKGLKMFNQLTDTRTGRKLQGFKNQAAKRNANYPHLTPSDWRWFAGHAFNFGPGYNRYGMNYKGHFWFYCEGDSLPGVRHFKKAHDVIRLNHTGWYGDTIQNETLCGIVGVFRFGKTVYIVPGVEYSDSDCDYFDFSRADKLTPSECWDESGHMTDTLDQAIRENARYADQMAQREAEENREEDEKFQAEQLCEQLADSIDKTRAEARALIKEIKTAGKSFSPAICGALREKLGELLGHVRKCRKAIGRINKYPFEYEKFYSLV